MKMSVCAGCGEEGYVVDTTAGEIVAAGRVVAVAPRDKIYLLVGRADGSDPDNMYCGSCAG